MRTWQALQKVVDSGDFVLHLPGGSGGSDNPPSPVLKLHVEETFYEMWNVFHTSGTTRSDNHFAGPSTAAKYLDAAYGIQIERKGNTLWAKYTKSGKSYEITSWKFSCKVDFTITNEDANFFLPEKPQSNIGHTPMPYTLFYGNHMPFKRTFTPPAPAVPKKGIMDWFISPVVKSLNAHSLEGVVDLSNPKNFVNPGTPLKCHDDFNATWSSTQANPNTVTETYKTTGYGPAKPVSSAQVLAARAASFAQDSSAYSSILLARYVE